MSAEFVANMEELQEHNVEVYLFTRQQGFSQPLVQAVSKKHWMKLPIAS